MDYHLSYLITKSTNSVFEECIRELIAPLTSTSLRLFFFIDAEGSCDYTTKKSLILSLLETYFGDKLPVCSVIAQKPLDAEVVLEAHNVSGIDIIRKDGYIILESDSIKEFLISESSDNLTESIYNQSLGCFNKIQAIFDNERISFSDVVRQWNYIEEIVKIENGHQHYQDFNDVRTIFYSNQQWANGYPAATGIGTQAGGIIIDLNAVVVKDSSVKIKPIDNDLQIAAHRYSKDLLLGNKIYKTTPKFERAKSIEADTSIVYISGTAAIRGEESLKGVGISEQTKITMENIENLISGNEDIKLKMLRVYLKYKDDLRLAQEFMSDYYKGIPTSYLLADVCREELIVEIEGIASS